MTQKWLTTQAALIVHDIYAGIHNELPLWADYDRRHETRYVRACRAAHAFILLAETWNKRFDRAAFLHACGLLESAKEGKKT